MSKGCSTSRLPRALRWDDVSNRKPAGVTWETWVDRQIREGRDRGDFDRLPGHGKPIADLDRPRDELWWLKRKLEREEVSVTPPAIQLRLDVEQTIARLDEFDDEDAVRAHVHTLNQRIRTANRIAHSGPPTTLMPLDIDRMVGRWRNKRQ